MDELYYNQNPDEPYIDDHLETESHDLPEHPPLPVMMFIIALAKDGFDIISFGMMGWLATALFSLILLGWTFTKSSAVQRQLNRWVIARLAFLVAIGMIPGINFIPEATIMVFLVHNKESTIVKFLYKGLEGTHEIA